MPITGIVPEWMLSLVAIATVFTVMFDLGLAIEPGELRWVVARPGLLAKGLFSVLIAVPALAWAVCRAFDLPRAAEVGIMLMAISPGAPVALRRSLDAGGHRSFAPALQIAVTTLAVVSMPITIAGLDEYYAGNAIVAPEEIARQVFIAQLLPLSLGMLMRRLFAAQSARLERRLRRWGGLLLLALLLLVMIDIWHAVVGAGWRVVFAIVATTLLAIGVGHLIGGPQPGTRTAVAISSAARNPSLALLVATLNAASIAIIAAVLAYFVIAAVTLIPYIVWRQRLAPRPYSGTSL
jgi:BASS family bile acid:Na+ symporter